MSIYYGPFYSEIFSLIRELSLLAVEGNALVFVSYKYTFALFWKRQARRLQGKLCEPGAI